MSNNDTVDLKSLNAFIRKNKSLDYRKADFLSQSAIDGYNWKGLEEDKDEILKLLKAYQRVLRILPVAKEEYAKPLLKAGYHSSLQIASLCKTKFIQDTLKIFDNDQELAELVYNRCLALRKAIAMKYVNRAQQLEPHARAASI